MSKVPTCAGCGYVVIEPAADKDGKRVFIRCGNPANEGKTGRVVLWCKAEHVETEMKLLQRPAWCKGEKAL